MLVTVLTPTYNRGYIIEKLYNSLKTQTNKNFEWIVIDDGSTDNTKEIFEQIKNENIVELKYYKKENGGKHTALNFGLKYARGNLLIIVDSDDYLIEDAIEKMQNYSREIWKDEKIGGISFRKISITTNQIIGNKCKLMEEIKTDLITYRYRFGIKGDLAECYKTEILKKYVFPIFENEKFVPEALIWNRIANNYDMIFYNEGIYMCDYLPDGYSQQFNKLRLENPKAYKMYYLEEIKNKKIPLKRKLECLIRYIQIFLTRKKNDYTN